jgi:hypothetical protein
MATIAVTDPTASVNLCNGRGPVVFPETTAGVSIVKLTVQSTGPSGVYRNPFAPGYVYFYAVTDSNSPDPYYVTTNTFSLLGSVSTASAIFTDEGPPWVRTYYWDFTVDSSMVATIPAGTPISIAAVGVNNTGNGILTRYNAYIIVVNGG